MVKHSAVIGSDVSAKSGWNSKFIVKTFSIEKLTPNSSKITKHNQWYKKEKVFQNICTNDGVIWDDGI